MTPTDVDVEIAVGIPRHTCIYHIRGVFDKIEDNIDNILIPEWKVEIVNIIIRNLDFLFTKCIKIIVILLTL